MVTDPALSAESRTSRSVVREFDGEAIRSKHSGQSKVRTFLLALLVVAFNAVGNLSLAWGMKHVPDAGVNPMSYVRAMLNPFVATGIVLLILWLLTRMALMSWADLSFALPLMASGYIAAAVLGKFVLNEAVGAPQWTGALLIFAGTVVVGATQTQTYVSKSSER